MLVYRDKVIAYFVKIINPLKTAFHLQNYIFAYILLTSYAII